MTAHADLLDAYVSFELERLSPERLAESLRVEVEALYGWLAQITLGEVARPQEISAALGRAVSQVATSPEYARVVDEGVRVLHAALSTDESRLQQLLPRPHFDHLLDTIVGMKPLRREIVRQLTSSSVYAALVADILYHGIKSFMLTDNPLARTLPGASSLIRFGQRTLNSAAPGMEKSIDRQLTAFINANIKTTIRESEAFLDHLLDDGMVRTMGGELWDANADRQAAELAHYVDAASAQDLADFAVKAGSHLLTTESLRAAVEKIVGDYCARRWHTPVRVLLEESGLDAETVATLAATCLGPFVEQARCDGFFEARLRSHFSQFLEYYHAQGGS